MKVAFCILAHNNPVHLSRLVHALDDPRFDCYIHVDAKTNLNSFSFEDYALQHSKLIILENRIHCLWGDISLVEAEFALYRKALETASYDYFVTLSGLDYPIQSNDEICRRLESANAEFITCAPLGDETRHRVQHFFFWKVKNQFFFRLLKKIPKLLRIYKKTYLTVDRKKWNIFTSSQWHALTRACIMHILQQYEQHPEINSYFRYSYAPDEFIVPTIIGNSPEFCRHTVSRNSSFDELPVIHYLKHSPNSMGTVKILTEEDYPSILASEKLFIRKCIPGISDILIEQIAKDRSG